MSQRGLIRRLLEERGAAGVSAHELIYDHGITQVATRIFELRTEEGLDIETIDTGTTEDGRRRMCNYVLRGAQIRPPRPAPPPIVPVPIVWECGCVRAADGRSWENRCDKHANRDAPSAKVRW